jgi:DNA gyrase subunit A
MINEGQLKSNPEQEDQEIRHEHASQPVSRPIKVSDDSDSNEILVFTSSHNVYKVQKKEISDKFQALQKIDFEPGEKPIYLTGEKHYSGFLIVAFENGKIGKISMSSFKTDYNRKKLKNAFNSESKLIFIELIDQDIDLVTVSSIRKVQVMKQKDGSFMIRVKRAEQTKLVEPEYYRKSEALNVVGYYLKQGDEI